MNDDGLFLYKKPDGAEAAADPARLKRRLSRLLGGQPAKWAEGFNSDDDATAEAAYDKLAAATCAAFDLGTPFDPVTRRGVREEHWLPVWNSFQACLMGEKTPSGNSPTTAPSTASTESSEGR